MASSETRETIENGNVDVTQIENGFKKDKARAKSNFTRSQNRLLLFLKSRIRTAVFQLSRPVKNLKAV